MLIDIIDKDTYSKIYAFDSTFRHLEEATKDHRKKERMRANIGLKTLTKWYKQGEEEYDRQFGNKTEHSE